MSEESSGDSGKGEGGEEGGEDSPDIEVLQTSDGQGQPQHDSEFHERALDLDGADKEPPGNHKYHPELVASTLKETGGNVRQASEILDTHESLIYRYIDKFDVVREALELERAHSFQRARETLVELLDSDDEHIRFKSAKWISKSFGQGLEALVSGAEDAETVKRALKERLEGGGGE